MALCALGVLGCASSWAVHAYDVPDGAMEPETNGTWRVTLWHEIATWFGYQSVSGFSERPSTFSIEDRYSMPSASDSVVRCSKIAASPIVRATTL